jgi:hypothetical protein
MSLLAIGAMLLSGCGTFSSSIVAQVPTAGPIQQGEQIGVNREGNFIRVIARGPRPGMTPTEVVQGFLDASASFDGNHAVARQYLTPRADAAWDTTQGVAIYQGVGALTSVGPTVTFRASKNGSISSIGRYEVAGAEEELRANFALVQDGEEWRIDRVPQGLILSQPDVERSFRSLAIYFFDPTFDTLVPDPRMVPVLGPGQATTLVRYLIGGPSPWLEPAVRTGFPDGVSLNIDSVPIEGGVARVDLTPNARNAPDSARRALSQQLVWTLKQLADVSAIDVTAGSVPLIVPGVASPQPREAWPEVDPGALPTGSTAYLVRPGSVARFIGDVVLPVPGGAGDSGRNFVRIAVDLNADAIAGVDGRGRLWRSDLEMGAQLTQVPVDVKPVNPVFDRNGDLWAIDPDQGLVRIEPDGTLTPVPMTGLPADAQVRMAVPSRDGTRVALIVTRGPRNQLLVGRIVRPSPNGAASVSAPVRVESSLAEVLDVVWAGADSLVVLGSVEAGALQALQVRIASGTVTGLGSPEGPISVAAAPGLSTLVAAADGEVYELVSGDWQPRARGTAPTYPN